MSNAFFYKIPFTHGKISALQTAKRPNGQTAKRPNGQTAISIFLLLIIFGVGCSKQTPVSDDAVVFVQKEFAVTSENEAKNRVMTFLEAVKQQKNSSILREPYPDMEVNEGAWTLEAAANYEKNVHIGSGKMQDEVHTYDITIANIVVNGQIHMKGTEMTEKYISVLENVQADESTGNKTAIVFDLELVAVSPSSTAFRVKVVFEEYSLPSTDCIPWNIAANCIANLANIEYQNTHSGCTFWSPNFYILSYDMCYTGTGQPPICLRSVQTTTPINGMPAPIYNPAWFDEDVPTAKTIAEGLKNDYVASIPTGQNENFPPAKVVKILLNTRYADVFDLTQIPPVLVGYEWQHFVSVVFISRYQYCY